MRAFDLELALDSLRQQQGAAECVRQDRAHKTAVACKTDQLTEKFHRLDRDNDLVERLWHEVEAVLDLRGQEYTDAMQDLTLNDLLHRAMKKRAEEIVADQNPA